MTRKKVVYAIVNPKGVKLPRNAVLWPSGNPKAPPEPLKPLLDRIKGHGSAGISLAKVTHGSRHLRWKCRQLVALKFIKAVAAAEPKPAKKSSKTKKAAGKPAAAEPNNLATVA